MGLFGKTVEDDVWATAIATEILQSVETIAEVFQTTGDAVASDPINGWYSVSTMLSELGAHEAAFKRAKSAYGGAGKPRQVDPLLRHAKICLDTFFSSGVVAMHWGKLHYSDASGAPGERARWETGLAQKGAMTRVRHNGTQFANNALRAAKAGSAGVDAMKAKSAAYKTAGPSLTDLWINLIPDDLRSELARHKTIQLSQVAQLGGWCFQRSAILGMIVREDPNDFIPMMWDPGRVDVFWQHVDAESVRIDAAGFGEGTALAYLRGKTEYTELFGDEVMANALQGGGTKAIERIAKAPVSFADARGRWGMDTAMGFGLGVRRTNLIRACLQREANPNVESWREAHEAGLDIPAEPAAISVEEQIFAVSEACRAFFDEYYPAARTKYDSLTAKT